MSNAHYVQGDVLLIKVDKIPEKAELKQKGGQLIIAYGEATGHHHSITSPNAALFNWNGDDWARITRPVQLRHQEHHDIQLPAGDYKIVRQKEYRYGELRRVMD